MGASQALRSLLSDRILGWNPIERSFITRWKAAVTTVYPNPLFEGVERFMLAVVLRVLASHDSDMRLLVSCVYMITVQSSIASVRVD